MEIFDSFSVKIPTDTILEKMLELLRKKGNKFIQLILRKLSTISN